jgi:hypothetical protein
MMKVTTSRPSIVVAMDSRTLLMDFSASIGSGKRPRSEKDRATPR